MTSLADKTAKTVPNTTEATREALDSREHALRHPWAILGGGLLVGYMVAVVYRRSWRHSPGVVPYFPPAAEGAAVMPSSVSVPFEQEKPGVYPFYPPEPGRTRRPSLLVELEEAIHDELNLLQQIIIRTGRGVVHKMITHVAAIFVQLVEGSNPDRRGNSAHASRRD